MQQTMFGIYRMNNGGSKLRYLNRWIYAVTGVVVLLMAGLVYAWSVLSAPIAVEFTDWSKAQLSLTFTLTMILFCVGGLIGGIAAKKIPLKVMLIISAVLMGVGFFLTSNVQTLAMLYISFGVITGLGSGFAYNSIMGTVSAWFPDKQGLISGILLMGFGFGSFLIGKIYSVMAVSAGWRWAFRMFAVAILLIVLFGGVVMRRPPKDWQVSVVAAKKEKKNFTEGLDVSAGVMLKRPTFWMYYIWAIVISGAGLALLAQAGGIASQVGPEVSAGNIATVVGLISIFNGIGRVVFGALFDARGHRLTINLVMILFIITALILIGAIQSGNFLFIILAFIVGGFAYGGVTPTNSAIINAFYGPTNYPVNFSLINTNLIVASFASTIAGSLYDHSESFLTTVFMIIILTIIGFVASVFVRKP